MLGYGSLHGVSTKQKLNATSSIEAELVGVHDVMLQIVWIRYFMLAQGIKISRSTLYQDKQSAILLKKMGLVPVLDPLDTLIYVIIKDRIISDKIEIQFAPLKIC